MAETVDRRLGRQVAAIMATHTVSHGEQYAVGFFQHQAAILVAGAITQPVGKGGQDFHG